MDLEATCIQTHWTIGGKMIQASKSFQNEIIEIGAVKINDSNDKLEIIDEFSAFIKPILNPELSDFCIQLTTITQDDINKALGFPLVLHDFREWLGNDYVYYALGVYMIKTNSKEIANYIILKLAG